MKKISYDKNMAEKGITLVHSLGMPVDAAVSKHVSIPKPQYAEPLQTEDVHSRSTT